MGRNFAGEVGPNSESSGAPDAAIMCPGPASFATPAAQREATATARSGPPMVPAKAG